MFSFGCSLHELSGDRLGRLSERLH